MKRLMILILTTSLLACSNSSVDAQNAVMNTDADIQKSEENSEAVDDTETTEKMIMHKEHSSIPVSSIKKEATENSAYNSPGKPSTYLDLDYTLSSERVNVGESVDVSISFKQTGAISTDISMTPGLVHTGRKSVVLINKAGSDDVHTFSVTPITEGIHYVNIFAGDEKKKPFAIRIIAGDKSIEDYLQKNGVLIEMEEETVVSMPADES